jgi:hypothetical protein
VGSTPGGISGPANPWASSEPVPALSIGGRLFIVVVTVAVPPEHAPLLPGTLYSYNIKLESPAFGAKDLGTEKLLVDESTIVDPANNNRIPGVDPAAPFNLALGYDSDRLPSFVTCPETLDELIIIQSGCRNSNSDSNDTTVWIDDLIADAIQDPVAQPRPHQLYLTGDQIYADDVPMAFLPLINRLGIEVIALGEKLPLLDKSHEATLRNFPAWRRGNLGTKLAHFTTGSANHLLSFSEFCAMYLHTWSPAVWRELADPDTDVFVDDQTVDPELLEHISPYKKDEKHPDPAERISNVAEWKAAGMRAFDIHLARTQLYRATVPRVRRALANCPTYMIFDDHEVTDDWNLSREWFDRVTTSPLGRTVVRNALSAYTLFQAWGNDPKKFESRANKDMLVKLPLLIGTSGGPVQAVADAIDAHLGMSAIAGGDPQPPDVDWHYTVDGPLHRTVVIETRTRRTYAGRNAPAKLLGTSLNAMVPAGPLTDGRELLIVVAPQPPLMPALFDQIAQPLGALSIDFVNNVINVFRREPKPLHQIETGAQTLEAESWGLEELGLEDFLKRVAPYQRVVILSGDVHFSATLQMDYWRKGQPQADRIVQLITSPSKNAWRQIVVNFVRSTSLGQTFAELGMPGERLAWNSAENVLVPPSVEGVPPGLLARMRRSPALLPAKNWPMGTVFKQKDGNPVLPDWRWRLDLVVDQRPDGDRPIGVQLPPPGPDIDPADPLTGYYQAAGRHQVKSAENYTHLRRLIFPAAIGVVTFPEIAGKRHVRHVLLSRTPGDPNQFAPNTVHETSLEPTTDPQPEIQFQPEAAEAESG